METRKNAIFKHRLGGVYAAAVTPFDADFRPVLADIPRVLDFLASRGCHGALMLGTTGEGPSCSPTERQDILGAAARWREGNRDFRLLAGTGTPSLSETIELTKQAFDLGVEGVVIVPPYYFRKASDDGLFDWFSQVIRQAAPSDGAVLGYHFPGTAGIGFSLELIERLKEAFPRQFAGLKDSGHDIEFSKRLGQRFGVELAVFSGTDSDFLAALQHHAAGCITAPANLISPLLRAVYDAFSAGSEAGDIQERIAGQRHILEQHLPFPPIVKGILHHQHAMPLWKVKPPLRDVEEQEAQRAAAELERAN